MKKEHKNILIIGIIIFIFAILIFYKYLGYSVKVQFGSEYGTTEMTTISSMIWNDINDDLIIKKINENPLLLNEECGNCEVVDFRTPLITAIVRKRVELIKYMVKKGADVEKNISILEEKGLHEFVVFFRGVLDEKGTEKVMNEEDISPSNKLVKPST